MTHPENFRRFLLEVLAQNDAEPAEPAERLQLPVAAPVTNNLWARDTPGITVLERGTGSGAYPNGAIRCGTAEPVALREVRMVGSLVPQFQQGHSLYEPGNDTRDEDEIERAAIAIEEGGVPSVYAEAFARLQIYQPTEISRSVWELAINDAGLFLDKWAVWAEYFGWAVDDIFGVPVYGQSSHGLVWKLKGRSVVALLTRGAIVSTEPIYSPDPVAGDNYRQIRVWLRT
jgi:hypothetical protein